MDTLEKELNKIRNELRWMNVINVLKEDHLMDIITEEQYKTALIDISNKIGVDLNTNK